MNKCWEYRRERGRERERERQTERDREQYNLDPKLFVRERKGITCCRHTGRA
jgi:hypothetical protein